MLVSVVVKREVTVFFPMLTVVVSISVLVSVVVKREVIVFFATLTLVVSVSVVVKGIDSVTVSVVVWPLPPFPPVDEVDAADDVGAVLATSTAVVAERLAKAVPASSTARRPRTCMFREGDVIRERLKSCSMC